LPIRFVRRVGAAIGPDASGNDKFLELVRFDVGAALDLAGE
jgi:hypothetical protein